MRIFLFILAMLWFAFSVLVAAFGKSAIHEVLGAVHMLTSAVFLVGWAVITKLESINASVKDSQPPQNL